MLSDIAVWKNVLQIWLNGYLSIVSKKRRNQISPISFHDKLFIIFKGLISDFFKLFVNNNIPKNKIWFYSISSNNYNALKAIYKEIDDAIFVSPYSIKYNKEYHCFKCNFRFKFWYDILFPINLFVYSLRHPLKDLHFFDLFFKVNGLFKESIRVLRYHKPTAIVFANDHEIIPRSILLAAKKLGIKTFYVQHAAVSKYFPPLLFDWALLEGEDSKQKYLENGVTNSNIELIGMPKFDKHISEVNTNTKLKKLGIAYNAMDDLHIVKNLAQELSLYFSDLEIIIRPHPSDLRKLDLEQVFESNPKKENSFEFLSKIDALIAADSSIHLEAVLMNVYSISYSFTSKPAIDYYGFIKKGLVEHIDSKGELKEKISNLKMEKPNIQQRALYYNADIGSKFYGQSSRQAALIIKKAIYN